MKILAPYIFKSFASSCLWTMAISSSSSSSSSNDSESSTVASTPPKPPLRTWDARYSTPDYAYGTEPNTFLRDAVRQYYPRHDVPSSSQEKKHARIARTSAISCLVLAAGEGRNAVYLAATYGWNVTAVDSSAVGLAKARALAAAAQQQQHAPFRPLSLTTIHADLADYDLGIDRWDVIVGIFCHVSPLARARLLAAIPRALRPQGIVLLECYTPDQPILYNTGGPHSVDLLYTAEMFQRAFSTNAMQSSSSSSTTSIGATASRNSHDGDTKLSSFVPPMEILRNQELTRSVMEGRYHTGAGAVVQFIGRRRGRN